MTRTKHTPNKLRGRSIQSAKKNFKMIVHVYVVQNNEDNVIISSYCSFVTKWVYFLSMVDAIV